MRQLLSSKSVTVPDGRGSATNPTLATTALTATDTPLRSRSKIMVIPKLDWGRIETTRFKKGTKVGSGVTIGTLTGTGVGAATGVGVGDGF